MTVGAIVWWVGIGWGVMTLLLCVCCVVGEIVSLSGQPWRERLRRMLRELPLVLLLLFITWPVVVVLVVIQLRREWVLERLTGDVPFPHPPKPLTEKDWLHGRDPAVLCHRSREMLGRRTRLLFAAACCRRHLESFPDPLCSQSADLAEQLAERTADTEAVDECLQELESAASSSRISEENEDLIRYLACQDCLRGDAAAAALRYAGTHRRMRRREREAQLRLLRDIAGNPFRPLPPRAFPSEVVELARACYGGDCELWPLLADALVDLGEPEAAAHCREGFHAHGCHVLDWILGMRH